MKAFFRSPWAAAAFATVLALAQAYFLPPFAGFDEPAHFSSILSYKFNHGHPKHPGSFFHSQVEEAMRLVPGPIHQLKPWKDFGGLNYREFHALGSDEQKQRIENYQQLKVESWQEGHVFGNWQAQHPPLYYALSGNILKVLKTDSLSELYTFTRLLSALLFSMSYFILAFYLCRKWNYDSKIIWWTALLPMPYVLGARITNDALAIPFFTLSILSYMDLLRKKYADWKISSLILPSAALIFTLGSKAYVLSFGPVVFVLGLTLLYQDRKLSFFSRFKRPLMIALPFALMLLVWSPWLYANWKRTGSITGMNELADLRAWGLDTPEIRLQKIKELYTIHLGETLWIWLGVLVHLMFISHWYAGTAFPLFYIFQGLLILVPCYLFYKNKLQRNKILNYSTFIFILVSGAFIYGWFKFILDLYMYHGKPEWVGGWYYWSTMAGFIVFMAQIFHQLKSKTLRIILVLQALALSWTLITQYQFFSGLYDRHPVFKYPVKVLTSPHD